MSELSISDWRMLQVSLEDIGPFRQGVETISFQGQTGPPVSDPEADPPGPSNLYMLIAPNARGKTTVLEAIFGVWGLLARPVRGHFIHPAAGGKVQVDVRATWTIDGAVQTVLLSIWTGSNEPLVFWSDDALEADAQAGHWARLGVGLNGEEPYALDESNDLGRILFDAIRGALGEAPTNPPSHAQHLPTIIYFSADRMLVAPESRRIVEEPSQWGYQPAYRFDQDGPEWNTTIDNLLVWLEWLQDGRLKALLDRVNEHLFGPESGKVILPPRRSELLTYVSTPSGAHPLSALSHGERALLQMFARIFSHMTLNTVLLIDEIELHLHTRWMNRMYRSFKSILAETPTLSLVFTTHDRELIQVFDYQRPEKGLTKGGFLITDELV